MRVRPHKQDEIEAILDIMCFEIPKLPNYQGIEVDRDKVRYVLQGHYDPNDLCIYILADDDDRPIGGGCAYCSRIFTKQPITCDLFLFIAKDKRTPFGVFMLMGAYKEWAKKQGARIIQATHTSGINDEGMAKLMNATGFYPIGTIFRYKEKRNVQSIAAPGQQRADRSTEDRSRRTAAR